MRQFRHIVGTEIPALTGTLHLGSAAGDAINGHARHLQNWMSGILNWHEGCHRYREANLVRNARPTRSARPGWLTGIGTSAARIGHASAVRLPPRQRPALLAPHLGSQAGATYAHKQVSREAWSARRSRRLPGRL